MFDHLTAKAAQSLSLSDEERIVQILSPKWIGYPAAQEVLNKLSDLLVHPKTHRMPNLLIIGETNNGKTMIAKKFCKMYPPDLNEGGNAAKVPVLFVQAPPVPDEGRFYNNILELLAAPHKTSDRVDKKEHQVRTLLERIGTKVLIVDEIHHVLAGSLNK
ncbi:MAG: TniB family NTP-binding protein, partial [Xanthomonadales bacterium]|nr:TniB family NTP-binding protein [Xanthomonadales bacterium]